MLKSQFRCLDRSGGVPEKYARSCLSSLHKLNTQIPSARLCLYWQHKRFGQFCAGNWFAQFLKGCKNSVHKYTVLSGANLLRLVLTQVVYSGPPLGINKTASCCWSLLGFPTEQLHVLPHSVTCQNIEHWVHHAVQAG